ncbi:MAG: alpha/beta hydrolase [Clostridia bacterium]|nr:alpha/beta hydrolase [Clostridia bacterium]
MRKHKKLWAALLIVLGVIALGAGGVMLYVSDYYPADEMALAALATTEVVSVRQTEDGLVFLPTEPAAGFIFYPGGLVDHTAYAPLMHALAERDVLCVLTDMPLRLAVMDMNAADSVAEKYPEVSRWCIGGHSLGGAMAASYAAAHAEELDGLALLAAYSTQVLPADMPVVSVYGTADQVLDWGKYEASRANLPADAQEIAILGGNHALFGSYGPQKGDGEATITAQAQWAATAEALLPLLLGTEE